MPISCPRTIMLRVGTELFGLPAVATEDYHRQHHYLRVPLQGKPLPPLPLMSF